MKHGLWVLNWSQLQQNDYHPGYHAACNHLKQIEVLAVRLHPLGYHHSAEIEKNWVQNDLERGSDYGLVDFQGGQGVAGVCCFNQG